MWYHKNRIRRIVRRKQAGRKVSPLIEALEDRTLLSSSGFLQGTVVLDNTGKSVDNGGTFDPSVGKTPQSGAIVALYQGTTTTGTPIATTTTDLNQDLLAPGSLNFSNVPLALTTTPNTTAVTLGTTSQTLTDTATLTGGNEPTGAITFTLYYDGGSKPVDTETVTVKGDGTYATPKGYSLSSTAAAGVYQWDATYSGDNNNSTVSDNNDSAEQVTVITNTYNVGSSGTALGFSSNVSYSIVTLLAAIDAESSNSVIG